MALNRVTNKKLSCCCDCRSYCVRVRYTDKSNRSRMHVYERLQLVGLLTSHDRRTDGRTTGWWQ